jgi:hypothetical protein
MRPSRLARVRPASGPLRPGQERASDHLRFIRDTMARAGSFTAVSGVGQTIVGILGVGAGVIASRQADPMAWLATWLAAAVICAVVGVVADVRKAARLGIPLFSGPARRFALTFLPPLAAGALLTAVFYRAGLIQHLPGLWLLLFGTGVVTGGAMSVGLVPIMGLAFMLTGVAAFLLPSAWGDLLMMAGFGGLNIVFGILIAVRHDG